LAVESSDATYSTGIVLNEFLANPKTGYANEWVELYNSGSAAADLAGWKLDDGDGGGAPHTLPANTTIAAGGFLVVQLSSALFNNSGDTVRLIRPDGVVVDSATYTSSAADASRCRAPDGAWYDCPSPSPGATNLPPSHSAPQAAPPPPAPDSGDGAPSPDTPRDRAQGGSAPEETQLAPSASEPTPRMPAWPAADRAGTTPYARATPGALYRGLIRSAATPAALSTSPSPAMRQIAIAPPAYPPARSPLGMGAGILLIAIGGAVAGYERLRPRTPAPASEMNEISGADEEA
jgi:hypothetical protein